MKTIIRSIPRKAVSLLTALAVALTLLVGMAAPVYAAESGGATGALATPPGPGDVCSIGDVGYATLDAALAATTSAQTTIKLLKDVNVTNPCIINNKNITFNLNGYNLIFHVNSGAALSLVGSTVDYTGSGSFQAITNYVDTSSAAALYVANSSCKLTYVKASGTSGIAAIMGNGNVIVNGNVEASGDGVYGILGYPNARVTVNGDITTASTGTKMSYGVYAKDSDARVTIKGNVTIHNGCGIYAQGVGSDITMTGNIIADGATAQVIGFGAEGQATVKITGDVTMTSDFAFSGAGGVFNYAKASVVGNVTATGADAIGLGAGTGGQVTLDGALTAAPHYIFIEGTDYNAADVIKTTKVGYKTYTDGTSTVWVKDPAAAPAITTASLPNGAVGTAYSQTLAATGIKPVSWSIISGSLPAGLALDAATGTISGTPTAAGASGFTVKAANGFSPDATKALSITIAAAAQHAPVTLIRSAQTTFYIVKGKSLTIPYAYDLAAGAASTAQPVFTWTSSDGKSVSVTPAGKVKGLAAGKSAKVTVTADNGVSKTFTVKVVKATLKATGVSVSKPPKTLAVGATKILKVRISPSKATGAVVKFSVDKASAKVVSVDKAGKVTALAKGTAKITVKAGGQKTIVTIKVK